MMVAEMKSRRLPCKKDKEILNSLDLLINLTEQLIEKADEASSITEINKDENLDSIVGAFSDLIGDLDSKVRERTGKASSSINRTGNRGYQSSNYGY